MKIIAMSFMLLLGTSIGLSNIGNNFKYVFQKEGIDITCYFNKVTTKDISEKDRKIFGIKSNTQSYVFAKLVLVNTLDSPKTVNLNNYYLLLHDKRSSKIYIDSYADYIITDRALQPKESFTVNVYWVFDGEITNSDISKLKLIYVD